jgi:hypothetical protein
VVKGQGPGFLSIRHDSSGSNHAAAQREHCCFCNGQGPQGRPQRSGHRPDNERTPGALPGAHGAGRGRSLNCAESLVRDRQPRRGTDARDPAWGGRPGRDRRAIGERWRSGWAYVRSLPDRLTSTASVCRQLVVRCWKRSSRSSVPALPVSVASTLRVATAKVEHTRHLPADTFSSTVQLVHQPLGSSVALRWRRERAPILRGHLVG